MRKDEGDRPTLVVIGGLPATGKSTIARALARSLGAAFVRVDSIEQAIVRSSAPGTTPGVVGYTVAYAVAADQLDLGLSVVAEAVNPLPITRDTWRRVAVEEGAGLVEVELVCSDEAEHRHRVETRVVEISGLQLPSWDEICTREYAPWTTPRLVLDTGTTSADNCVRAVLARVPSPA